MNNSTKLITVIRGDKTPVTMSTEAWEAWVKENVGDQPTMDRPATFAEIAAQSFLIFFLIAASVFVIRLALGI